MKKELEEVFDGILTNENHTLGLIKDGSTEYSQRMIKISDLRGKPILSFKSLPIHKLRKHKTTYGSRGDCFIGDTIYDSHLIALALSLIGKNNVSFHKREKDGMLGIKVNDKMVVVAPVILEDDDELKKVPKLEELIV